MREGTKRLFLYPFITQEIISYTIMVPAAVFFAMNIVEGFRSHVGELIIYTLLNTTFSIPLGAWIKYHFVKPAIEIMENEKSGAQNIQRAVRSAAILPLMEAITAFVRWAVIGWGTTIVPLYMKGYITFSDLFFGGNIVGMAGLSGAALYYLYSENSLMPFYAICNMKGILDKKKRFINLHLNARVLITILLIAMPPIGNFLGVICISIFKKVDMSSLTIGFVLIVAQTIIMTFLNSYLLIKGLSLSVGRMSYMLDDIAGGQGDLTKRLPVSGVDEVGRLAFQFNTFVGGLEQLITKVKDISLNLHHAIVEVSAGSQVLSQSTQEQAASVEEISASIDEMNGAVQQNLEFIQEGETASKIITGLIDKSKTVFADFMKATQEISKDSSRIADIVSTVNEVAFHTNLLALNASVEAARAGEHGKGFAVVAGEVRSLAQRSALAAGEIKELINLTIEKIRVSDDRMYKTFSSMEELMSQMEFFFKMVSVIGTTSKEQAQNIDELSKAISQIDTSTQSNASTVEELASVLDNLQNDAEILAKNVNKFIVSTHEN